VPRFLYLLQCARERATAELEGPESAVMQLVYAPNAPVDEARRNTTFVLRNSTWNQGRNALLARAKSAYQGLLPLYLVFMDCDAQLREVRDFGHNTGQPYRTFESYLARYLPLVGHAHFDWQPYDEDVEVMRGMGNYDAIFNAFHRDAVNVLLPYVTHWDRHSWHYSQLVVHTMTSAVFPNGRMQFNALRVLQRPGHAAYPRGAMWEVPFLWILPLFRSRQHVRHLPVHHINLEIQPRQKFSALIRNVHPLLAVVHRIPRPSSLRTPLFARPSSIANVIDQMPSLTPNDVPEVNFGVFNSTQRMEISEQKDSEFEFDWCHPYWRHRTDKGHMMSCKSAEVGGEGALRGRGAGPWLNWAEFDGTGGQGAGGGHAGVEPGADWLRGVPLFVSEKEALRSLSPSLPFLLLLIPL